jgi:hypothetical protein
VTNGRPRSMPSRPRMALAGSHSSWHLSPRIANVDRSGNHAVPLPGSECSMKANETDLGPHSGQRYGEGMRKARQGLTSEIPTTRGRRAAAVARRHTCGSRTNRGRIGKGSQPGSSPRYPAAAGRPPTRDAPSRSFHLSMHGPGRMCRNDSCLEAYVISHVGRGLVTAARSNTAHRPTRKGQR